MIRQLASAVLVLCAASAALADDGPCLHSFDRIDYNLYVPFPSLAPVAPKRILANLLCVPSLVYCFGSLSSTPRSCVPPSATLSRSENVQYVWFELIRGGSRLSREAACGVFFFFDSKNSPWHSAPLPLCPLSIESPLPMFHSHNPSALAGSMRVRV